MVKPSIEYVWPRREATSGFEHASIHTALVCHHGPRRMDCTNTDYLFRRRPFATMGLPVRELPVQRSAFLDLRSIFAHMGISGQGKTVVAKFSDADARERTLRGSPSVFRTSPQHPQLLFMLPSRAQADTIFRRPRPAPVLRGSFTSWAG